MKQNPGWYWTFEPRPDDGEPGGRCGPYKTQAAAARSARSNGFATVTKRPKIKAKKTRWRR
jgi:hypothetical protein